jgi:hypothetical protein
MCAVTGEWKDDLRHGRGVLTSGSNDFMYDGDWEEDKRTGHGHCVIRGRESYTGAWAWWACVGAGLACA